MFAKKIHLHFGGGSTTKTHFYIWKKKATRTTLGTIQCQLPTLQHWGKLGGNANHLHTYNPSTQDTEGEGS